MEWISVEERLPEFLKPIFIHNPSDSDILIGYFTVKGWYEHFGSSCGCCAKDNLKPTHWMLLPEPPKK